MSDKRTTGWRYTARGILWTLLQVAGVVGAFLLYAALLTGCGSNGPVSHEGWYRTGNGREVWCIKSGYGMSCDWENARKTTK